MAARSTFPDTQPACAGQASAGHLANDGNYFTEDSQSLGLTIPQAYDPLLTWFFQGTLGEFQQTLFAGGVTATYLDNDCWPDIAYTSGTANGIVAYINQGGSGGFTSAGTMPTVAQITGLYTNIGVADLQGDYHRELVLGNLTPGSVRILKEADSGQYQEIDSYTDPATQTTVSGMPMPRNTFGMAFGDYDNDGYPDIYLAHYDAAGLPGSSPAFWHNNGGQQISPYDSKVQVGAGNGLNQNYQFSPSFADIDGDGWQDLLIAADFLTTVDLQNVANTNTATQAAVPRVYSNVTDTSVIKDQNGMGSALGDFFNDGMIEWFVSDVYATTPQTNVGILGNHLYHNTSTPGHISFQDVTAKAGVANAAWAWGSCAADFNNDGFLDILVVNGMGPMPANVSQIFNSEFSFTSSFLTPTFNTFSGSTIRLFMNNGDGTFTEQSASWLVNAPVQGRGVTCFDFDRDGDVDVAMVDQSVGIKFFENHSGAGAGHHFLNIRVVGNSPNTDALGAKVYVTADLNGNGSIDSNETQMRVSAANSNFNSQNLPDLHFGLGKAATATQVRIVWPDGLVQTFANVAANQFLIYKQP